MDDEEFDSGTISEKLPCGGMLNVYKDTWYIWYYYQPSDGRFKAQTLTINADEVYPLRVAMEKAWKRYEKLKSQLGDVEYSEELSGVQIRSGGPLYGICYDNYNIIHIQAEEDVQRFIDSYIYAIGRAEQLQAVLSKID